MMHGKIYVIEEDYGSYKNYIELRSFPNMML